MLENEAVDADNIISSVQLAFDQTTQFYRASVRRLNGAETHIDIPAGIFPSARSAAQTSAASWSAFLNANPTAFPPSLRTWHTAIRQDIVRQIVGFCPVPPLD
jgi:hypothetical protein